VVEGGEQRTRVRWMERWMGKPVCAVVGVGEGNGAALARAFARTGMAVALLARRTDFTSDLARELSDARPYACDVSDPSLVAQAFATIRTEMGDPATLVYNAGSGVWTTISKPRGGSTPTEPWRLVGR
jgi:NAD(P)-dependent dehydrogenase (short-subunit alcohol dehydrogenase family)